MCGQSAQIKAELILQLLFVVCIPLSLHHVLPAMQKLQFTPRQRGTRSQCMHITPARISSNHAHASDRPWESSHQESAASLSCLNLSCPAIHAVCSCHSCSVFMTAGDAFMIQLPCPNIQAVYTRQHSSSEHLSTSKQRTPVMTLHCVPLQVEHSLCSYLTQ